jgi:hypothetical protein
MWKRAIMEAVFKLTKGDSTEPVSFAQIAYEVADAMDLEADSHDRGGIYNKVVQNTKGLVEDGLLRYERESIAGHPAMICLGFATGVKPKQPTLFDITGEEYS